MKFNPNERHSYEVMREIFNSCANIWKVDMTFPYEVTIDNIEESIKKWCGGFKSLKIIEEGEGTLVITVEKEMRERFTFSLID